MLVDNDNPHHRCERVGGRRRPSPITVVSVFVVCALPDAFLRLLVAVRRLIAGNDNVDAFIPHGVELTWNAITPGVSR